MTTRISITVKESNAKKARAYAAKNHTSVSKLVDDYLSQLSNPKQKFKKTASFTEQYAGILSGQIPEDITALKDEYLKEKYGI